MADPLILYEEFRMYMPGFIDKKGKTYFHSERDQMDPVMVVSMFSSTVYRIQQVHTSAERSIE
jgi:hypothetical protein